MRKTIISLFILSALLISGTARAQKFGHVNLDSLLAIMPEMAKVNTDAAAFYKQLETDLMKMQLELDTKMKDYDAKQSTWSAAMKQLKEAELNSLNQRIQNFQQSAQSDFNNKKAELMKPVMAKVNKSIREVALERGLKYVFDSSKEIGVLLFADPADDLFNLLRSKLGIPN